MTTLTTYNNFTMNNIIENEQKETVKLYMPLLEGEVKFYKESFQGFRGEKSLEDYCLEVFYSGYYHSFIGDDGVVKLNTHRRNMGISLEAPILRNLNRELVRLPKRKDITLINKLMMKFNTFFK